VLILITWKTVRIWLLAALFTGVLCVLAKLILFPNSSHLAVTSYAFPSTVPLPQWQLLDSTPLKITDDPNFVASRRYRYQQDRNSLTIDMHYLIHSSGDVKDILKKHIFPQKITTPLLIHQKQGVGFYTLFTQQEKAYLSSCINPQGGSTVTFDQFRQNRNTYDVQPTRFLLWLLGLKELRDWRCLWNVLSVPLETSQPEEVYPILESAWFSWYSWWEPRFPPPL
jgi:cyanosortase A-associated protein